MTARPAAILILACAFALNLAAADTVGGRILGGTNGPASAFPEVVRIQTTGGVNLFTGTLISPVHVLTSASAVTDNGGASGPAVVNFVPSTAVALIGGQTYGISSVIANPQWTGEGVANARAFTTGNPDIAILVLSQRVTAVRPAPIYRKEAPMGQPITIVGFGVGGNGTTGENPAIPPSPAPGQVGSGTTTIETVFPDYYRWAFDNNGEADTAGGPTGGEEGAPSFVSENNVRFVAGVTTVRNGTGSGHIFGTFSHHARVDSSAAFIDSIIGASACDLLPVAPITAPGIVRNVPGEQISVAVSVRNQHPTNAAIAFNTTVYLSTDLTLSANDILLGTLAFPTGLAPNTTQQPSGTFNIPAGLASGTYFLLVLVDAGLANQQTDYQNDTNSQSAPQVFVTGNTAPTITSPASASVLTAFVDELVVFSVGATDLNSDPLAYSWNFGDGTFGTGVSVEHTFSTAGTYNVVVTVNDNFTGSVTSTVTVVVIPLGTIEVIASKFKLDFRKLNSDTITLGLRDKVVFGTTVTGKVVKISLGQDVLDSATILKNSAKGVNGGKFSVKTSTGTFKYTSNKRDLRQTLARYGALNGDFFVNVPVSVLLNVGTTQYGAQVPFFYKAKLNQNGQGKF